MVKQEGSGSGAADNGRQTSGKEERREGRSSRRRRKGEGKIEEEGA
jgi:hypothetical protein